MAHLLKFLCLGLFLALMAEGVSGAQHCSSSDIFVEQIKTGVVVVGKPEFEVLPFNACPCAQANVKLACKGFKSAEKIDTKILVIAEEVCHLPVGFSIAPFSGYVFNYASDSQFPLKSIFSQSQC